MLRKFWIAMSVIWAVLVGWKLVALTGIFSLHAADRPSFALDCDPLKTAQQIVAGSRSPAPEVYYWGKGRTGLADWSQPNLRPFWRGLPVGEWVEDQEWHLSGDEWLSALTLNEKCLKAESFETLLDLPTRPRFIRWYEQQVHLKKITQALALWQKECFQSNGRPDPQQFRFSPTTKVDVDETSCEKRVNEYLNEEQIFILQDQEHSRSWIIRNPDCIAKIKNQPADWAKELWVDPKPWTNNCHPARSNRNVARVWIQSLVKEVDPKFEKPVEATLVQTLEKAKPPQGEYREKTDDKTIPFAARDFAISFDEAFDRCAGKRQLNQMQASLQKISDRWNDLHSTDLQKEFEPLCR